MAERGWVAWRVREGLVGGGAQDLDAFGAFAAGRRRHGRGRGTGVMKRFRPEEARRRGIAGPWGAKRCARRCGGRRGIRSGAVDHIERVGLGARARGDIGVGGRGRGEVARGVVWEVGRLAIRVRWRGDSEIKACTVEGVAGGVSVGCVRRCFGGRPE